MNEAQPKEKKFITSDAYLFKTAMAEKVNLRFRLIDGTDIIGRPLWYDNFCFKIADEKGDELIVYKSAVMWFRRASMNV